MQYGRSVILVSNILKHFAILSLQALLHHYLAIILTYDLKKRLNKASRIWQEIAQDVAIVKQTIATMSSFSFLIALPELSHHFQEGISKKSEDTISAVISLAFMEHSWEFIIFYFPA